MEHYRLAQQWLYDSVINQNSVDLNFYFLGDSITQGYTGNQETISTGEEIISDKIYKPSYPQGYNRFRFKYNLTDSFKEILDIKHPTNKAEIINMGYPDYNVKEMRSELNDYPQLEVNGIKYPTKDDYPKGLYFIMLAQNDAGSQGLAQEITMAYFCKTFQRIINESKKSMAPFVILIEPTNLGGDEDVLTAYKNQLVALSVKHGIKCIDFRNIDYSEEDYLILDSEQESIRDKIHMSSFGYKKMANYLYDNLFNFSYQFSIPNLPKEKYTFSELLNVNVSTSSQTIGTITFEGKDIINVSSGGILMVVPFVASEITAPTILNFQIYDETDSKNIWTTTRIITSNTSDEYIGLNVERLQALNTSHNYSVKTFVTGSGKITLSEGKISITGYTNN